MLTYSQYSLSGYENLLRGIKDAGYQFIFFDQIDGISAKSRKCLLRHDVDVDVGAALEMAKVEESLGVSSTYFLMLRSPVYNLMSRHNHQATKKIHEMGHALALHYDAGYLINSELLHENHINHEADWLEKEFGVQIKAISFHQPCLDVLAGKVKTGQRINTYDKNALANFKYFSDSNRTLKLSVNSSSSSPSEIEIQNLEGENIQLLIHPMWWVYDAQNVYEVWDHAISNNFHMSQKQIIATERAYGHIRDINLFMKKDG